MQITLGNCSPFPKLGREDPMQEHGRVIMGRDLLKLRPIESDLKGLLDKVNLDIDATTFGLFDEKSFDPAFKADVATAQKSVVIFSGFITPRRVGEIGDLLRTKVADGVKVRCVTRPPKLNGTMDPTLGKEALDILEGIGCAVDCRANIHQKVVLIDNKVVWHGSLNALSHAHRTEESMTRVVNEGLAQTIAAAMSKQRTSAEKAASTVAEPENPRCPKCQSRTVYAIAKRGANREFFYCEAECGWRESLQKTEKRGNSEVDQPNQSDLPKDGPPCTACGSATKLRPSRYGLFYGCIRYPDCKGTVNPDRSAKTKTRSSRRSSGTKRGSRHRARH
jgi:ssDNA-binding Zn-finger/Zn-ribbon topoisomerase 1